ncbi:MAG: hypothetical protein RL030_295 [Pseudomonadota bacterium]|jgi:hypothetical protein
MNSRNRLFALLLTAWIGAASAADWQVVLLKPSGCLPCNLFEQSLKRSAQMQEAVLEGGAGDQVMAGILRRNSSDLSAREWAELRALPYFDESLWRRQAAEKTVQVLLKRDDVIASAGDINDSADLRSARFPPESSTPYIGRDLLAVRNERSAYVADMFRGSWNLSWFYRLALDPTLQRSRTDATWIAANPETLTPPLGPTNVMLISTATGAADNEIFNALRIEEIRDVLSKALAGTQARVFYGSGQVRGANALEIRDGRIGLVRRDVADATAFTPEAAVKIFQSIRARPGSRNLLVLIGHGGPEGAGMWGSPLPLSPGTFRSLHEHGGGDDVLVSGNCFGGVMARTTSCGFFGARPDLIATGCQADAAEVAQSRDYLHMFFSSLTPATRMAADADGDGAISFSEAHWYASTEGDVRNVTYTSIDALADAWFDAHPAALPRSLTVKDILALAPGAPAAEARAVRNLLAGFSPDLELPLADPAGAAMRWTPRGGLPRALAAQVTRRLIYLKESGKPGDELARLQSCEKRSVAAFLQP